MYNQKLLFISILCFAVSGAFSDDPPPAPQKAWRGKAKNASAEAENFKPAFFGNSIVCGNKTVQWDPDGRIRIGNSNGELLMITPHFCYVDDQKKVDWNSFTQSECRVKAENGKVVWNLKKQFGGKGEVYDAGSQTLEIMPDGLLKVQCHLNPITVPGWTPRKKYGSMFLYLPYSLADGKDLIYNGKRFKLDAKGKVICSSWKDKQFRYICYPGNDADTIALNAVKPEVGAWTSCLTHAFNKTFRITLEMNKEQNSTFTLDLRRGTKENSSPDKRGGIDFQAVEKLELPDSSRRNLLPNSSFERGFTGYHSRHPGEAFQEGKWDWKPFEIVEDIPAPFGKHVLRFNTRENTRKEDFRQLSCGANITTHAVVVPEGTYTISFYAKCEKGKSTEISFWVPNFHSGSHYWIYYPGARKSWTLTDQWKRYSYTIKVPRARPLEININARLRCPGKGHVWIDALQLESGDKATPYEPAPAEGRLVTSSPENFVSAKDKLNGRLIITTAKPNISGTAAIRVRNFFGEDLLKQEFPFRSDASGLAEINLPLDTLPGLGVFLIRTDYQLEDGSKAYEHNRYAKVAFLDNTHPNKNKFSFHYNRPENHFQFIPFLERWKKLGVGAKHHHHTFDKRVFDLERSYGVEPGLVNMTSFLRDENRKMIGFGIIDDICTRSYINPDDPRLMVRDFWHDSNGELTTEYLEKFQNAVKTIVSKHRFIPMWLLAGEFLAKFPQEWWSKEKTPEACARNRALLMKAFVAGVKEANPDAKVFEDSPCNMRPEGGIAETELLLKECNKLGVRFDLIAFHPYRYSPESPDLDADTQVLFKMLDRVGYKDVPVVWPEMMHWGPFDIPQWGVISSTWTSLPRTWPATLLSYDMGSTEKRSAAWYARAWLVVLKYGDRILGATAGNTFNNCFMDLRLTPYAAQLVPNTLGNVLGDAKFKKDIRFAPFIRAYVFEDAKKRPVAAVWCHLDKVEDGYTDSPVAEADFGDSLESVIDFMNSPRSFTPGKFRFPVTAYPLFLRGKPGTLDKMIAALDGASVISGEGIAPLDVLANPRNLNEVAIQVRNYLSRDFAGTLNGRKLDVPASGRSEVTIPLKKPLSERAITRIDLPVDIKSTSGGEFRYDLTFESLAAKHLQEDATFTTVDWSKLPAVPFIHRTAGCKTSGTFGIGWNKFGLFIQVTVQDKIFSHKEYKKTEDRWKNDCLQIYFDTMANARVRTFKGYDEDDYDYAVFPNPAGDSSIVYRYRSVEQQLGLATEAPKDNTVAPDIPSSFTNKDGKLTYRVFFPAKYLLPIKLQPGWVFGFGLYAADSTGNDKVDGALTLALDGSDCYNKPHLWPAVILAE